MMLNQIMWQVFEKTGSLEAYLYYSEGKKYSNRETEENLEAVNQSIAR